MTENESIEYFYNVMEAGNIKNDMQQFAYETAIKALEEIQQYRAIGTVEECREAREKQRARKPKIWTTPDDGVNLIYDMYKCPNCGKEHKIDYYNEYSYCPNCGQAVELFE